MTTPENEPDFDAVNDYEAQAREFLAKGREYLAAGDLHQASEKGWGAAAHMAKAVAVAQGWQYDRHPDFSRVMNQAFLKNRQQPACGNCEEFLMICTATTMCERGSWTQM